jgi:3-isopropylmalate/(R)-2-methylmalate dehydratase large subunit
MTAKTLYEKVWQSHVVKDYDDGTSLLYIDRHLVQEISSPQAFSGLTAQNRQLVRPAAHIAGIVHVIGPELG